MSACCSRSTTTMHQSTRRPQSEHWEIDAYLALEEMSGAPRAAIRKPLLQRLCGIGEACSR